MAAKNEVQKTEPKANVAELTPQVAEIDALVSQKSDAELEAIFEAMQTVVLAKRDSKRNTAILEIERIASEAGITVMIKGHRKAKGDEVLKKYVNPNNANEIFDGKGRMPKWLKELIKSGRKLEEFAVAVETQPAASA